MPLLRFDSTTADWVIFSPSRSLRPHEIRDIGSRQEAARQPISACPFCPGNEQLTPAEIFSIPADPRSGSRWRVRVIPNKFPALRIEERPSRSSDGASFQRMGGCGAHEVIVESPEHSTMLAQQSIEQIQLVLATVQSRYQDLMRDQRFQTVVIFKNHGIEAGTSLAHPHWQLIATPVVPRVLRAKHSEAIDYFDRTGESLYCVLLRDELAAAQRIVAQNADYVALMPYASHVPFETWILPTERRSSYRLVPAIRLRTFAEILKTVLLKLHTSLANPAFNLTIDDVPRGDEEKEYFMWHMRILPRLINPAGFELGSGMSINTVLPEDAVAFLNTRSTSDAAAAG